MTGEYRCGGLLFTSKFDSGNLAGVEKVERSENEGNDSGNYYGISVTPDYEFNVWTKPDCGGTQFENGNRSWFYFGIKGYAPNKVIKLNITNLNRQGKLYTQGMVPLVKVVPSRPHWERIRERVKCGMVEGQFNLTFTHRFSENRGGTTYFAFCYPWSYTECQQQMENYDKEFKGCADMKPDAVKHDDIYYHRELLVHSIDKRRVDLMTITSCRGMCWEREPRVDNLFPDKEVPRPHKFTNKRVYFVSSRVHPGETPASFVFNGFLKFILRKDDARAIALRDKFIFKMIPLLNPDGVFRGHYRTDQRGVNLNRLYLNPDLNLHPTIYASRELLIFYHHFYRIQNTTENEEIEKCAIEDESNEKNNTLDAIPMEENTNFNNNSPVSDGSCPNDCLLDAPLLINGIKRGIQKLCLKKDKIKEAKYVPFSGDLKSIPSRESGIVFYIDLHGHASKRGCFIYGNHLEIEDDQVDNLLFPRLISLNSANFDFNACNFTERNMYLKDKRDGMSKEGSGRVAMHKTLGIIHSYTIECNYNTGRTVNCIPQATHDRGKATPPPAAGFPPKYTQEIFEEVGRATAIAALDFFECNPWSRLVNSEFTTMENLRFWVTRYVRSSRGAPILPKKMARISTRPSNTNLSSNNQSNSQNNNQFSGNSNSTTRHNRIDNKSTNGVATKSTVTRTASMRVGGNNNAKSNSMPSISTQQQRRDLTQRQKTLIRVSVNSNGSNRNSPSVESLIKENSIAKSHKQVSLSFTGENKYALPSQKQAQKKINTKDSAEDFADAASLKKEQTFFEENNIWQSNLLNQFAFNNPSNLRMLTPSPSGAPKHAPPFPNPAAGTTHGLPDSWNHSADDLTNYQADVEAMNFMNNVSMQFGGSKMFVLNNKTFPLPTQSTYANQNSYPARIPSGKSRTIKYSSNIPQRRNGVPQSAKLHKYDQNGNNTTLLNPLIPKPDTLHIPAITKQTNHPMSMYSTSQTVDPDYPSMASYNNYPLTVLQKPITPLPQAKHDKTERGDRTKASKGRLVNRGSARRSLKQSERSNSSGSLRGRNQKNKKEKLRNRKTPEQTVSGAAIKLSPRNVQSVAPEPGIVTHLERTHPIQFQISAADLLQTK